MVAPYASEIQSPIDLHSRCGVYSFRSFPLYPPFAPERTLRRFSSAPLLLYYYSQYSRFKIQDYPVDTKQLFNNNVGKERYFSFQGCRPWYCIYSVAQQLAFCFPLQVLIVAWNCLSFEFYLRICSKALVNILQICTLFSIYIFKLSSSFSQTLSHQFVLLLFTLLPSISFPNFLFFVGFPYLTTSILHHYYRLLIWRRYISLPRCSRFITYPITLDLFTTLSPIYFTRQRVYSLRLGGTL